MCQASPNFLPTAQCKAWQNDGCPWLIKVMSGSWPHCVQLSGKDPPTLQQSRISPKFLRFQAHKGGVLVLGPLSLGKADYF